jgi:glyoxylase-like metal-dependent hydrolase (beta-lactamase superfamily II)
MHRITDSTQVQGIQWWRRSYGLWGHSTIIYGEREGLVIDTQFTLSNAHRLVADILETGCDLTCIYITHFHPDHFLSLCVVNDAFPSAPGIQRQDPQGSIPVGRRVAASVA